jgi:hypothetical protein
MSATAAARIILRLGFRRTARLGAILVLVGLGSLLVGALADAGVGWISAACGVVGIGLGPSSLSQLLAVQQVVPERQRGVATSLVPFFRTVGGSIGVGTLGGVFAAGLAARLGSSVEAASRLLATGHGAPVALPVSPAVFRHAIESSLLPVFSVLFGLAAVNLFLASGFPEPMAAAEAAPKATEGLA